MKILMIHRGGWSVLILFVFVVSTYGCVAEEQGIKLSDLEQRVTALKEQSAKLEQTTGKLEQTTGKLEAEAATRSGKLEAETATRVAEMRDNQEARIGELSRHIQTLQKEMAELIQRNNAAVIKHVDHRLDSLDVAIGALLLRIEELEKRPSLGKNNSR